MGKGDRDGKSLREEHCLGMKLLENMSDRGSNSQIPSVVDYDGRSM